MAFEQDEAHKKKKNKKNLFPLLVFAGKHEDLFTRVWI